MVPLVNTRADAEAAVSYCLYPPEGQRSVAYPVRLAVLIICWVFLLFPAYV